MGFYISFGKGALNDWVIIPKPINTLDGYKEWSKRLDDYKIDGSKSE